MRKENEKCKQKNRVKLSEQDHAEKQTERKLTNNVSYKGRVDDKYTVVEMHQQTFYCVECKSRSVLASTSSPNDSCRLLSYKQLNSDSQKRRIDSHCEVAAAPEKRKKNHLQRNSTSFRDQV